MVFLAPEGLLLLVWCSIGLWVEVWVGLYVQNFYSVMGWVGLGWVEQTGPMHNSATTMHGSDV